MDKLELLQEMSERLKEHVYDLADKIGERNFAQRDSLNRAGDYIHGQLKKIGHIPTFHEFHVDIVPLLTQLRTPVNEKKYLNGEPYRNVVATIKGRTDEVIVVGAHYDTAIGTPGADDNASGIAVLLELARLLFNHQLEKTITLVAFTNEEPPFFRTSAMGSAQFVASALQEKKKIIFMISLEMLGFYSEEPFSQSYPPLLKFFYPDRANFIAIAGNIPSKSFVKKVADIFRRKSSIPVESLVAPRFVPGVDFSDQLNFWNKRIPAVMITDTAFYRNPNYHGSSDLPHTLDYNKMAQITQGLYAFLLEMGNEKPRL